jgi:ubiquinol-cytochrome c reductase cytochrome b subunit
MYYTPTAEGAFASIEYIMRDVRYGWLLRYIHTTGASAFFIVLYLHMFRGLLYGSYKKPRELVWLLGMGLYFLLMAEAFMGYLLPWGQMSYWGAQVITSLFGAIPGIGPHIVTWLRGDYAVSGVTLNRFFALHIIALPLLLLFLVWMHLIALHQVGSNNPDGIEIKKYVDKQGKPIDGSERSLGRCGIFYCICCNIIFYTRWIWIFFRASKFYSCESFANTYAYSTCLVSNPFLCNVKSCAK